MIANASDVKACLERVLALMAERDKINEGIADVIDEFKPKGVLGKGIRRVATLRRMDPNKRRSDEQLYTDYEDALGTLPEAVELVRAGKTYDEAAEATGLSRATVARMVRAAREVSNERENETPDHDHATGEITEARPVETRTEHPEAPVRSSGHRAGALIPPANGAAETAKPEGQAAPTEETKSCDDAGSPGVGLADGPFRVGAVRIGDSQVAGVAPGPQEPTTYQEHLDDFRRSPDPAPAKPDTAIDDMLAAAAALADLRRAKGYA